MSSYQDQMDSQFGLFQRSVEEWTRTFNNQNFDNFDMDLIAFDVDIKDLSIISKGFVSK
jgi:hypothetical protein